MNTNVLIIGLGLIGGSLSLALQRNPDIKIYGYDQDEQSLMMAKKLGVIHEIVNHPKEAANCSDYIVFATPVNITIELMKDLPKWNVSNTTVITDTGSTKKLIMKQAEQLINEGYQFIGGHPMAGSHKSGVAAAKAHLFENAFYVLTPHPATKPACLSKLESLLAPTKGKLVKLTAEEHDQMTAVVSHFPHLIAASLVRQLKEKNKVSPMTKHLAAGGFRDITRIASSNPVMWRDITLQNRDKLIGMLEDWQEEMETVKNLLMHPDPERIEEFFSAAKKFRDDLPVNTSGAVYTEYDLYVDIPDYPGVISEITGYLAKDEISITNLRIIETRTDVFGVLVISFQTPKDRERGEACIKTYTTFDTYIS
ncbi:prephenate dehydrogenase [Chungangia koreensis]|uniref:Prephenate dehydrogenase n=1 Tax=Chungangia koreensis TaxID=752657 RepID=A0ABV8X4V1_9LACT